MDPLLEQYIEVIRTQKRYSPRTVAIYAEVLEDFERFCGGDSVISCLSVNTLRAYQISLLDERALTPRTVNLHLSVLSGLCRYLMRQRMLKSNPVHLLSRPKEKKRLPSFFKKEAMEKYLASDSALSRRDFDLDLPTERERRETYALCLNRIIVSILYSTGIRRAELIGLRRRDVDFSRRVLRVRGKGDKMREIPLVESVIQEISLYLNSVGKLVLCNTAAAEDSPLLVTRQGSPLYPVLVDRAVKEELSGVRDITGRKSPHVLRHTLATELLGAGTDLNSIKELLGHSSLAATQVYTHNSIERLQKVYETAHPRAKKGGKNGD